MARVSKKTISGKAERMEKRRLEAGQLFAQGRTPAEVRDALGISYQSAHDWSKRFHQGGLEALRAQGKPGPPQKFSDAEGSALVVELKRGALAHGYRNDLWTIPRVGRLIVEKLGKRCSDSETFRLLRRVGWTSQKPKRRARERNTEKIEQWKTERWPALAQEAKDQKRTIVFVDESGLTQKPARKNTWAPRGETPVLEFNFRWDKLSVIGGITLKNVYFQMHEGSIKSGEVISFVEHLRRQIKGPMLIIWDGLRAHWSKAVRGYVEGLGGEVKLEQLPAYAPELNPVEYIWGHLKQHELPNFAPKDLWELSKEARKAFRRIRRQPTYLRAFWIQTELSLETV